MVSSRRLPIKTVIKYFLLLFSDKDEKQDIMIAACSKAAALIPRRFGKSIPGHTTEAAAFGHALPSPNTRRRRRPATPGRRRESPAADAASSPARGSPAPAVGSAAPSRCRGEGGGLLLASAETLGDTGARHPPAARRCAAVDGVAPGKRINADAGCPAWAPSRAHRTGPWRLAAKAAHPPLGERESAPPPLPLQPPALYPPT